MSDTANLGIPLMPTNPSAPETVYSQSMQQIDDALSKVLTKVCSAGGTIALTQAETRNYGAYKLTGTPAAAFVFQLNTTSNIAKCSFGILNLTGKTATISSGTGANTVTVLNGTYVECRMLSVNDIYSAGAGGGGGGSPDFAKISALAPTGNVASFTSIPGTYSNLMLIGHGRSATAAATTDAVRVQFNADTGANYAKSNALDYIGGTIVTQTSADTNIQVCDWPSSTGIANYPGSLKIIIPFYALTVLRKSIMYESQGFEDVTIADIVNLNGGGVWNNASAITRVDVFLGSGGNFSNAHFNLYGLM